MKNIIFIIFALVLGVAEAWGQDIQTLTPGRYTTAVESGSTDSKPIEIQDNGIVIYRIPTGVTVNILTSTTSTANAINASGRTGARPAILLPEGATLVVTGGGTLNLSGGNAADGVSGSITNGNGGNGGGGAAPGIGGMGGTGGKGSDSSNEMYGKPGTGMGKLYILGNVTVNVKKGKEGVSKVGTWEGIIKVGGGEGGYVPTYAIGAGGRGGHSKDGESSSSDCTYDFQAVNNGFIFQQSTATVTYKNAQGNTDTSRPDVQTEHTLEYLSDAGYTFKGYRVGETWVVDEDGIFVAGGSRFDKSISVLDEYWTKNITLDQQGGTDGSTSVEVVYGCSMKEATAPSKSGHVFMGYFSEPNGHGTQYYYHDMSSKNLWNDDTGDINTLYAYWLDCSSIIPTVRINYNSNGGSGTMQPQLIRVNDHIKENRFVKRDASTKEQYEFLRWNTKADGSGVSYKPGDIMFATEGYSEITLYAQWNPTKTSGTYVISTPQDLLDFAALVNGGSTSINGILAADINMSGKTWTPIGNPEAKGFNGVFDGNGYIVSNLTMADNNTYERAGLIGFAKNATIKNVTVNNVTLYAKHQMGAVCGRIDGETSHSTGGIITRCGSFGTYSYTYKTSDTSGNAHAAGSITTASQNNFKKGSISNIWASSTPLVDVWSTGGGAITPTNANPTGNYSDGSLCLTLNDNVSGSTSWTQTFGIDPCPRPTNWSRAVYKEIVNDNTRYYNIYNIYFVSNGGTSTVCSDTEVKRYSDGSDIAMNSLSLPTTTREGYTFLGWYTEKEGGVLVSESSSPITDDLILYAHWAPISYPVTLVKQGGTGGTDGITVTYDSEMPEATAPTRTGFTFNGYFYNPDGTGTQYYNGDMTSAHVWDVSTVPDGGFKLYAHWTPTIYTVNLDKQEGTGGTSSVTVTYGGFMPTVLPNDEPVTAPTRTGFTFAGYYSGINGTGTKYYNENMESVNNWDIDTNPCTLYAHWTNVYRLTFDVNGGNTLNPNYKDIIYNNEYGELPTPTWTGHTFDGWFTSATGGEEVTSETKMGGANETVYAHWTIITYTVTLYLEGGSGGTTSVEVTYGSTMPSATAPTRPGYIFGGYYTGTNGTGTQYYNVDMTSAHDWDIDVYPINSGKLYANWTPITYTVTFNPQKGSVDPTTKDVNYGNTYGELPTPTRHGFLFKGWYTTENGGSEDGTEITGSETYSIIGNQTLYAHWNTTSFDIDAYSAESPLAGFYFRTFFDSQVTCILPAGVTAYKGNIDGRYLVLTAIVATDDIGNNVIPKNVPVILRMDPNETTGTPIDSDPYDIKIKKITLTTTEYDPEFTNDNNGLIGSDDGIATAPANSYILSFGSKGLGFYAWATHPLEGHKAYVINSSGSSAKALIFRFEDDAAGISQDAITDFDSDDSELVIHNLNGIRISKPQKGINIINGKKVWVK